MSTQDKNDTDPLDQVLIAAVSLAAGIAANHPAMGQDHIDHLRRHGVRESHLAAIVNIARRIRDEAAAKLDHAFNQKAGKDDGRTLSDTTTPPDPASETSERKPTPGDQSGG